MNIIRKAKLTDAPHFLSIKNELKMPTEGTETNTGGFLLGADEATYHFYIQHALALVAEKEGEVIGFGIAFPDEMVKASALWEKKDLATWYEAILPELAEAKVCYFDQLAFLPNPVLRRAAVELSYHLIHTLFSNGHTILLATTVQKPILNNAAIPFIKAVGGRLVGNIQEHYEGVGEIASDIYLIRKEDYLKNVEKFNFYKEYQKTEPFDLLPPQIVP